MSSLSDFAASDLDWGWPPRVMRPVCVRLLAQPTDLLSLRARRQTRPQTLVRLRLPHTLRQRLRVHPPITRHRSDRTTALKR